jgi:hypothetical protein
MCGVTFKNQPSVRGQPMRSICLAYPSYSIVVIVATSIQEAVRYNVCTGSAYANHIHSGQPSTY